MPGPFADLEARVNAACLQRLANAAGQLAGQPVAGIFNGAYAAANVGQLGVASTAASFELATASVPGSVEGAAFVLDGGAAYTVAEHQPDGTGWSLLILEVA